MEGKYSYVGGKNLKICVVDWWEEQVTSESLGSLNGVKWEVVLDSELTCVE